MSSTGPGRYWASSWVGLFIGKVVGFLDKEEFLDVIYWARQILGVILGRRTFYRKSRRLSRQGRVSGCHLLGPADTGRHPG